jgi:hypothetical protein
MNQLLPMLMVALAATGPAEACEVRSGPTAPVVVELYTSEGCDSCPPADRWLSSLKDRAGVVPLAFHVDYWDRLGWVDRFASAAHTQRQQQRQRTSGARFIYTPQVIANGMDWRRWPGALPAQDRSTVALVLSRSGSHVQAQVTPTPQSPAELSGYWAAVEHGQVSRIGSGENKGATLHHDHVVRAYQPAGTWRGPRELVWGAAPAAANGRGIVFVVEDAATGRPVQAVSLAC